MTDLVIDLCNTSPSSTKLSISMYTVSASPPLDSAMPPPNKRKVNFSLTLDIKQKT